MRYSCQHVDSPKRLVLGIPSAFFTPLEAKSSGGLPSSEYQKGNECVSMPRVSF